PAVFLGDNEMARPSRRRAGRRKLEADEWRAALYSVRAIPMPHRCRKPLMPRFALQLLSLLLLLVAVPGVTLSQEPILARIVDVRSLPVAEAQQGKEARIRGVVVYVERVAVFVQDELGSTFFRP